MKLDMTMASVQTFGLVRARVCDGAFALIGAVRGFAAKSALRLVAIATPVGLPAWSPPS